MRTGPQPQIHVSEARMSGETSKTLEKLDKGGEKGTEGKAEHRAYTSWCRTRGHLSRALGANPGLGTVI